MNDINNKRAALIIALIAVIFVIVAGAAINASDKAAKASGYVRAKIVLGNETIVDGYCTNRIPGTEATLKINGKWYTTSYDNVVMIEDD